jgi:hypothetical protein
MLAFVIVIGLSVLALTPLALPLLRLAWEAVPRPALRRTTSGESLAPETKVEEVVRERLYGRRERQVSSTILPSFPPASNRS